MTEHTTDPQAEAPVPVAETQPEPLPHVEPGPAEPAPEPFTPPAEAAAEPAGEGEPLTASDPGLTVVDAPPSAAAPGADIVGESQQPLPGEQPGVVAETPVVAQSAADPHPEDSIKPREDQDGVKAQSADDPHPELTTDGATKPVTDIVTAKEPPAFAELDREGDDAETEFAEEGSAEGDLAPDVGSDYEGAHPSQIPVALRPTPAGPSSHPVGRQRRHLPGPFST